MSKCERCEITKEHGILHHYEWGNKDNTYHLFFNVAEIRLAMMPLEIDDVREEPYPYQAGFEKLVNSHEITHDHIAHIPPDRIRPSLIGNMSLINPISGESELHTIMLDGHHSALRMMGEKGTVLLEIIPTELMESLTYKTFEELRAADPLVLEW